jgi:predicted nuclease of predicted toxin-antitoxin system
MLTILADHNIEGQVTMLWGILSTEGWAELLRLRLSMLVNEGLPYNTADRDIWRFAQENGMILITANRRMKGNDSLEQTIREENTPDALPVLTVGNINRMQERTYRERCAERLAEIVTDLENYRAQAGFLFRNPPEAVI